MATPHRQFKDKICEQFARLGKAMAAPKRLELLDLLCQGPSSSTMAFERFYSRLLALPRDEFIDVIPEVPPTMADMGRLLRLERWRQ